MPQDRKGRFRLLLLDLALIALGLAAAPCAKWMLDVLPDCYIAQMGLPCPSCGGTRAVAALCRGDVVTAWGFHPAVVLVVLYVIVLLVVLHLEVLFRLAWARFLRVCMTDYRTIIGLAVAFVLFGILRNLL